MYMKKELEGARYSNSALLDNNSNLQVEIDSLNNHIKVISKQNEDLTIELDQFVPLTHTPLGHQLVAVLRTTGTLIYHYSCHTL